MNKNIYKNLYIPIIAVEIYLIFTVILYIFGPWEWKTNKPILLYSMLILFQGSLALGYIKEIRIKSYQKINLEILNEKRSNSNKITIFSKKMLNILLIVNLIFVILNLIRTLGLLSLGEILNKVLEGVTNPASQYRESKIVIDRFGGSILSHINVLLAPLLWMSIPISIYRFKEFSFFCKFITIITIVLESFRWVAIGTNKGFIDIIIIFISIYSIKKFNIFNIKGKEFIKKKTKKRKITTIFVLFLLIGIALYFFSNSIGDRVQMNWSNYEVSNGNTPINFNSSLMKIVPSFLKVTLIYLGSYLTQGYYALSLTTSVNWTPMFGIGNSMFLMENFGSIINKDLYQFTYQSKLEIFGWDPFVNWHSFYVWIANDVGLIGVIFIMYFLGKIFAAIVYDAFVFGDNIAVVIFCMLIILFIYIPANNQILSYPTTFMAFWILTFIWGFKKKYRLIIK